MDADEVRPYGEAKGRRAIRCLGGKAGGMRRAREGRGDRPGGGVRGEAVRMCLPSEMVYCVLYGVLYGVL